ncbi:70cdd2be-0d44-4870-b07d-c9d99c77db9f [Sclerotinia trifoliorum]|uniref:70cdd2be-0d44-4870-b07d-c9d99c77db9f n=1 Tax=Sclerotinia trifoliorum TaxID=28548 RepID=A0A8H2ZK93_9HELO|nr:70cdd2be-0d44-4870-b07d-c9d99c77db9f [Sclerotinia trifoliorum]
MAPPHTELASNNMSSQSNESSRRGKDGQSQRLLEVDGKKPNGNSETTLTHRKLENSNVDTKPASKPKRGTWRKAFGLLKKVEMTEEQTKEIMSEINKIQKEIQEIEDNYENNQKQKSIWRKEILREYEEGRKETSAEEDKRRLKHLGTDAPYIPDRIIHQDVFSIEQRWKEDDRIADAKRDDLLRPLYRKEKNLYSKLKERERLQHEEPKAKGKISTREGERLQLQKLKEKDDISVEEAKSRLKKLTPFIVPQQPSYIKERKPSSSPEELKMELMLEWADETCKEWIYDHLEDYLDTYEIEQVKDDLAQMQEICGQRMFRATESEWQDWLYDAGRVMYCKLQSIVTTATEKRTAKERNCGSGSDRIMVL